MPLPSYGQYDDEDADDDGGGEDADDGGGGEDEQE